MKNREKLIFHFFFVLDITEPAMIMDLMSNLNSISKFQLKIGYPLLKNISHLIHTNTRPEQMRKQ